MRVQRTREWVAWESSPNRFAVRRMRPESHPELPRYASDVDAWAAVVQLLTERLGALRIARDYAGREWREAKARQTAASRRAAAEPAHA